MEFFELTDLGFAICGLAFAVLAIALRPGTVGTAAPRIRLRLASLGTVAWAGIAWWMASSGEIDATVALLLSIALVAMWLWQLDSLVRWQGLSNGLSQALRWAGIAGLAAVVVWMMLAYRVQVIPAPGLGVPSVVGLALCSLGLFAIEQLYRNAPAAAEVALRWLGLGVGGLLVTELVVFSQVLLLAEVPEAAWTMRGAMFALCALALFRGARTMPDWSFGLSVSRHVAFYASSFLLVGSYLVLLSLAGWLLLTYAGEWHPIAQVSFAGLAALMLGLALFSGKLLQRLKVFISAHFYPQRYDYRAEWLRFTRTLSVEDTTTSVQQRAIQAVAQIVSSPHGSLWRRDADGSHFECAAQWPTDRTVGAALPASDPLAEYLERTAWLIDLPELRRTPQLYGGLALDPAKYGAGGNALIVPLLHVDQLYGWIVLERASTLGELNFEDRDLLKTAGRHVAAHLAQFDADARLAEAHQFETYNRMTAFVMHDLKNIAAQLRLISQNAERHRRNPEFVEDSFRTIASAATRMTKLIAQLTSGIEGGTLQTVDLATCAERAVLRCSGATPVPQVIAPVRPLVFADLERLTTVIEHAIRNAQDATAGGGEVRVEVGERGARAVLCVIDTGEGMDARFVRERLFRPFDTTKGPKGMGIGAFQMREYVRSIGGDVEVRSDPGKGTAIALVFSEQPVTATNGRGD